jgi:predicted Zn-dependent peptidase
VLLDRWRGVFIAQCDPPAERLREMVGTMRAMLDDLRTNGIEEDLLRRAQRHLTEGSCFQRDTATRRVQRTLGAMAIGRAPGFLDEMNVEIGLRTPKQINDAAPFCFSAIENPVVVLVGNISGLGMSHAADLLGAQDVGQNVEVARVDIDQIVA